MIAWTMASHFSSRGARVQIFKKLDDFFVHPFVMKKQRDFINALYVLGRDDRILVDIAEKGDFALDLRGQHLFRAADQDIRLNSDFAQLHDAMLSGFGLQLFGGLDKGDQGQMDV